MGSNSSKSNAAETSSSFSSSLSSSSSAVRKTRSKGRRIFQPSCLVPSSASHDSDNDEQVHNHQNKENGRDCSCTNPTTLYTDQTKVEFNGKTNGIQPQDDLTSLSSNSVIDEWGQSRSLDTSTRTGSISFRLSRTASIGSSRACPVSSSSSTLPVSSKQEESCLQHGSSCGMDNESKAARDGQEFSIQDTSSEDLHTSRNNEIECLETRNAVRRNESWEPAAERNVRFSRTLSVGRLRDRVIRRSTPYLPFSPLQPAQDAIDVNHPGVVAEEWSGRTEVSSSESFMVPEIPVDESLYRNRDRRVDGPYRRETRYHDLLEHRSNFLERRRRIRSQVHALQRLGSRFENFSGHERSCILSGQNRMGRCGCRNGVRDLNSNEDSSARASISRIVMLAEALFEVLDEIHQQSVVLSSQPSLSSIGSVPAPDEIVDSLPVKLYSKLQKHLNEEAAQCYICLVEYEEGDSMRVLPCHHEFHTTCIDKWLKEIHRVCPLCRGDICRSDLRPVGN
ncbi:uncharacterized protein LOC124919643 isoform X2 [Impatiens glandulifera]|uniref:uncharacterized protein LOC124919643 isoform X2 n=1 Tax=Impatiens glandulifera TaxID=253017 RepID=UPI001FB08DF5|nr:uncharacterized protein LOC124919643 isoform X2 [Impatiens glandulifera]